MTAGSRPHEPDPQAAGPAVVVAGDAFVDLISRPVADGARCYVPYPGGSCLNVAVGLARLGVPTSLLARLSTDHFGDLIRARLASDGVLATHLLSTPDLTTLAMTHVSDGLPSYSFHASDAADRSLLPEHLADLSGGGALPEDAALHVGSVALVLEPQAGTICSLVRRESRRRLVSLDPNVRPGLIADRAAYVARIDELAGLADVVKASDEDLAFLRPGEPPERAARHWLDAGAVLVLLTFGADGAWGATAGGVECRIAAPSVTVADTVGAGDAFTSAVLAHLHAAGRLTRPGAAGLDRAALQALLRDAVLVAADTCTRPGADPPHRADLARRADLLRRGAGEPEPE